MGYSEAQAGIHATSVDQHRAGAALAVIAAFLGAGQLQVLAEEVEQGDARVQQDFLLLSVNRQPAGHGALRCTAGLRIRRQDRGHPACQHHDELPPRHAIHAGIVQWRRPGHVDASSHLRPGLCAWQRSYFFFAGGGCSFSLSSGMAGASKVMLVSAPYLWYET